MLCQYLAYPSASADERVDEVGYAAPDQRPHLTRQAVVSFGDLRVCKIIPSTLVRGSARLHDDFDKFLNWRAGHLPWGTVRG